MRYIYLFYIQYKKVVLGYLANKFYFSGAKCKSKNRVDGKLIIVTGSNIGIGYETALELAKRGSQYISFNYLSLFIIICYNAVISYLKKAAILYWPVAM